MSGRLADVIELPAARAARERASIAAEAADFWRVDVAHVSVRSERGPDGRWRALVAGPRGFALLGEGATRELAEDAARPRHALAATFQLLPPDHALEAIERALMGVAVSLPPHLRTRLYAAAAEIGAAASSATPLDERTDP